MANTRRRPVNDLHVAGEALAITGVAGAVSGYCVWGAGALLSATVVMPIALVVGGGYYFARHGDLVANQAHQIINDGREAAAETAKRISERERQLNAALVEATRRAAEWENYARETAHQFTNLVKGVVVAGTGMAIGVSANWVGSEDSTYRQGANLAAFGLFAVGAGVMTKAALKGNSIPQPRLRR